MGEKYRLVFNDQKHNNDVHPLYVNKRIYLHSYANRANVMQVVPCVM